MNKASHSKGGAADFLARLDVGHRVWAFAAAEARIGMVAGAVADDLGQVVYFENAACRPAGKPRNGDSETRTGETRAGETRTGETRAGDPRAPEIDATDWVAVVKPSQGSWTFAFLSLAPRSPYWLERLFPFAEDLADNLGVRCFAASRDDRGEVACRLYDNGDLVEELAFEPGKVFRIFKSNRREAPPEGPVELAFFDELCAGLGLRVPAGYPAVCGDEPFFAAEADQEIERVDLLLPPAPTDETMVFEDEETMIFEAVELEPLPELESPAPPKRTLSTMKRLLGRFFGSRE